MGQLIFWTIDIQIFNLKSESRDYSAWLKGEPRISFQKTTSFKHLSQIFINFLNWYNHRRPWNQISTFLSKKLTIFPGITGFFMTHLLNGLNGFCFFLSTKSAKRTQFQANSPDYAFIIQYRAVFLGGGGLKLAHLFLFNLIPFLRKFEFMSKISYL